MTSGQARALVAIDGIDGSGKSVLAGRLAAETAAAGIETVTLAVDDFRRPVDWLSGGGRSEADIYYDDYYDLRLLDRCVAAFLDGSPSVEIPVFDAAAHRLDGHRTLNFAGAALGIVEGVFILRLPSVSAAASLIYLRTSFAAARQRIVARDTARGRDPVDVDHRIKARYFPSQERYLREFDPIAHADVLVDHEESGLLHLAGFRPNRLDPRTARAVSRALSDFAAPGMLG
jgi:uridine kinase